jgi:hypothetical protein
MRKYFMIVALAIAHFVAYTFCALREFDTGAMFPFTLKPAEGHATWLFLMKLLEFPFVTIGNMISGVPDEVMLLIFILNSLLWGTAAYYLFSKLHRRSRLTALSF